MNALRFHSHSEKEGDLGWRRAGVAKFNNGKGSYLEEIKDGVYPKAKYEWPWPGSRDSGLPSSNAAKEAAILWAFYSD